MSELLLKNADIYVDERKVFLKASLHIKDGKIFDIYNRNKDLAIKTIDLGGKMIIPAFCSVSGLWQRGASHALVKEDLGTFIDLTQNEFDPDAKLVIATERHDIEALRQKGIKVILGHTRIGEEMIERIGVDGIGPLYYDMPPYDPYRPGPVNYAFDHDAYVLVDIKDMPVSSLKFLCKNVAFDRLIFIGDHLDEDLKADLPLSDLIAYTSLNVYRLLDLPKPFGKLIRGNRADILILDEKREILSGIIKGEVCR